MAELENAVAELHLAAAAEAIVCSQMFRDHFDPPLGGWDETHPAAECFARLALEAADVRIPAHQNHGT